MAKLTMAGNAETKVITNLVRFSYVKVFEPDTSDIGKGNYSVSIIIPKNDKDTIKLINKAIDNAKESGKQSKWGGKIPTKLEPTPLHDGDEDRPDDEAYKNAFYLNAKSKTKPGVIDINMNPITSEEELYSGCYGRASITFFAYDSAGKKGVSCGLNNLQKLKDGDFLGGRASAESDFGDSTLDTEEEDGL